MGRLAEVPEEDTMVPLGHEGNGRQGRQCARIGKVGEEPEEVTPVVGRVALVGLMVVQISFLGDFSFPELLTLLLAAAAAVGRGVRSGRVLPH